MSYLFNPNFDEASNCEIIGKPGFLVSGAPINHLSMFEEEIKKAVKDANPHLSAKIDYDFLAVFYRNDKNNKDSLENITKTCGGKVLEEQHFYIIQPLRQIIR